MIYFILIGSGILILLAGILLWKTAKIDERIAKHYQNPIAKKYLRSRGYKI
jgi:hypothetical protein